ncbi:MAG: glycosyltransferase [Anaerolineae bacterium]|nr:MAG: glycosyltransferase [Anaerolineae bacterium]
MISYSIPSDVREDDELGRPALVTSQGGKVAVDQALLELWRYADGRSLEACLAAPDLEAQPADTIRAALACLAQAGLLRRHDKVLSRKIPDPTRGDLVSAVIVAHNGKGWLEECIPSLLAQTHSPLEVIVVDNGSSDDTMQWLRRDYPQVNALRLAKTQSLAAAINQGISNAEGVYILLLNQDVRLEPDALAHMLDAAKASVTCAAVAAKLKLWWAPSFLNGLGNRVDSTSWGSDVGIGHLDLGQFASMREVPSACFAAALIVRSAWEEVGPVDEGFPMYYEDSEWCYRARLLGYSIAAAPHAVVYHAFGGREGGDDKGLTPFKLRNVAYGRLRFAVKLLQPRFAARFLWNYLNEDVRNLIVAVAKRDLGIGRAYVHAWLKLIRDLPDIIPQRRGLQARRVRPETEVYELQNQLPGRRLWRSYPELTWSRVQSEYLSLILSQRTSAMPEFAVSERRPHFLIVSNDVVDTKMAGPGVRYLEMARALKEELEVTLAIPSATSLQLPGLRMVQYWEDRPESLKLLVENADIALISGYMVEKFPFLEETKRRLVVDLYDPFFLENLHYYATEPTDTQDNLNRHAVEVTNRLAMLGDYFICGSERQRDFWLGVLGANRRINPSTFGDDASLRSLIDVVGIGFPKREPKRTPFLRGIHPAFTDKTPIVLWGGGIWNWLDPLTLVEAWPKVLEQYSQARLVFLGTRHPNPSVPEHEMAAKTVALAEEISEKDETVFFYEWLPYEERESLLTEANVGVTLHPVHIETRFSIRTRVMDYFWARLPVLITSGDVVSEWVSEYAVGKVVPPHDTSAVAEALCEMLESPLASSEPGFDALRETFNWQRVVRPLLEYCLHGQHAPDWDRPGELGAVRLEYPERSGTIGRVMAVWRAEGFIHMLLRIPSHLRWRLRHWYHRLRRNRIPQRRL